MTSARAAVPRAGMTADRRRWLELGVLAAFLMIAALTRLPDLDARGQWDVDQGHDMRVLAALVGQGQLPLLGPVTSAGTFHHGALYYYLLAPSAFLAGSSPVGVTVEFALLGIAAVGATWWLARLVGGPVAAAVAGGLLAVSPAGISESTFIWNANLLPLFAALAAIGVVKARRTGRLRWWALAAAGTMATMQLHWLGGVVVVPVAAAWLLELRRARRARSGTDVLRRAGVLGVVVIALGYLPLAVHEATAGASEIRAVLAYLAGGGAAGQPGLIDRLLSTALHALAWPVVGSVTDRPLISLIALLTVLVLGGIAVASGLRGVPAETPGDGPDPWAVRWLAGSIGFGVIALAILAASLPDDHAQAFLDPLVLTLVGTGVAILAQPAQNAAREAPPAGASQNAPQDLRSPSGTVQGASSAIRPAADAATRLVGPALGLLLAAGLAAIAISAWPPAASPDGGWRLADAAAAHVVDVVAAGWPPTEPRLLVSLPDFKPDDALRFPLERRGFPLEPPVPVPASAGGIDVGVVTIVCDPLFDATTGAACGGPAEERWMADAYPPGTMQLAERFKAGDRRIISIYGPSRLALRATATP